MIEEDQLRSPRRGNRIPVEDEPQVPHSVWAGAVFTLRKSPADTGELPRRHSGGWRYQPLATAFAPTPSIRNVAKALWSKANDGRERSLISAVIGLRLRCEQAPHANGKIMLE